MSEDTYRRLARQLDALPNGFPPTTDGVELRLLARLFSPEEAALAAMLSPELEIPEQIAARILGEEGDRAGSPSESQPDLQALKAQLKQMARKGLISAGRLENGLGYGLLPFVVGIYENQAVQIDAELARLFEDYYQQAFGKVLNIQPAFHRVVPVQESVRVDMEIQPYESARQIVMSAQAWGVTDCICRKQKALIGEPCKHPIDACMVASQKPGVFDSHPYIRALTSEQALDTLRRTAKAGLVHSVSNSQGGIAYICNCCTCSCGILRGIADLGIANAVARSAFVNQVDETLCLGCLDCIDWCQFSALSFEDNITHVDQGRCVGCGVCVPTCPEGALGLVRRPEEEILAIPPTPSDWGLQRLATRHLTQ